MSPGATKVALGWRLQSGIPGPDFGWIGQAAPRNAEPHSGATPSGPPLPLQTSNRKGQLLPWPGVTGLHARTSLLLRLRVPPTQLLRSWPWSVSLAGARFQQNPTANFLAKGCSSASCFEPMKALQNMNCCCIPSELTKGDRSGPPQVVKDAVAGRPPRPPRPVAKDEAKGRTKINHSKSTHLSELHGLIPSGGSAGGVEGMTPFFSLTG